MRHFLDPGQGCEIDHDFERSHEGVRAIAARIRQIDVVIGSVEEDGRNGRRRSRLRGIEQEPEFEAAGVLRMSRGDGREQQKGWSSPQVMPFSPGRFRAILVAMKRGAAIAVIVLVLAPAFVYAVHLGLNYAWIQNDLRRRAAVDVRPSGDDRALVDDGVVVATRREMHVQDRRSRLAWLIAVPATGKMYSCDYDEGFRSFEKGDLVTLIHTPPELDDPDSPAFLIDENRARQGKVARVSPFELDGAGGQPDSEP
jgi:hypothetical protein